MLFSKTSGPVLLSRFLIVARGKSARWFSRKKLVSKRSFVDFLHPRNTFKYSAAGQRVVGQLESWGLKKGKK